MPASACLDTEKLAEPAHATDQQNTKNADHDSRYLPRIKTLLPFRAALSSILFLFCMAIGTAFNAPPRAGIQVEKG